LAGELVYFVIPTRDDERAKRFYGELFGWRFGAGNVPGGSQIENTNPAGGLFENPEGSVPQVFFQVDDIHAAVERVRELGGEGAEPQRIDSGWIAPCRDDQGIELNLWSPAS
jgi:uncharacterized protein